MPFDQYWPKGKNFLKSSPLVCNLQLVALNQPWLQLPTTVVRYFIFVIYGQTISTEVFHEVMKVIK